MGILYRSVGSKHELILDTGNMHALAHLDAPTITVATMAHQGKGPTSLAYLVAQTRMGVVVASPSHCAHF